jgi:hypothetical protein
MSTQPEKKKASEGPIIRQKKKKKELQDPE